MKKLKVTLSLLMVILIFCVSIAPTFAQVNEKNAPVVISEDLVEMMENCDDNEKIKVYVWYKDINQDEVDVLTTKATGLTPENCEVITEFPSIQLWSSLEKGEATAQKQMDEYMKRTKTERETERTRTDTYSKKHREIAIEKYNQKSRTIREELSINDSENIFSSEFAPMIIAEMTKDEILSASKNPNIEEINLYYEIEIVDSSNYQENFVYLDNGTYAKQSLGLNEVYSIYGLTGEGVDVGLVETNVPGLWIYSNIDFGINYDEITVVEDPNHPVTPAKNEICDKHWHSNNSYRVMAHRDYGIATNINKYATQWKELDVLHNVEELIKLESGSEKTIDVLEVNFAIRRPDFRTDIDNVYTDYDKYYDHIVSNHDITVVVAGGNNESEHEDWIACPGMANNVITVSAYDNMNDNIDSNDMRKDFCWKNSSDVVFGCEKPDVVLPQNFYHGGTSEASPALTATIALMLELKPSLSLQPEAMKAIVIASCHRKVSSSTDGEIPETMVQGITERQGAGAPDAWTMACIISQGTYGVGTLSSSSISFNVIQPTYGAENMNVSIAWIRENTATGSHLSNTEITAGQASNLNLSVYNGDAILGTSSLQYSSTEMCYVPLSETDFKYKFTISQYPTISGVRFGYAWSTDNMKAAPVSEEGIYHINNKASTRYMTYSETTSSHQAVQRAVTTQAAFSDIHNWVVKSVNGAYNIIPGGATSDLYLGVSSTLSGTSYLSELSTVATPLNLKYNDDGTCSILNSTNDKILSYSSSNLVWNAFDSNNGTPATNQKWYFAKVNYLVGDANADGSINSSDQTYIQYYLARLNTPNNMQLYLSDANRDGILSIMDSIAIGGLISDEDE